MILPFYAAYIFSSLYGKKETFLVFLVNKVKHLSTQIKEALQEKEGIPKDQIRLIYAGKVMNDEMKIELRNILFDIFGE